MQLAEAMACGTTCISTGAGALGEVAGGFAIELHGDAPSEIARVVRESYEQKTHQRDSRAQIAFTRRYNWDAVGQVVGDWIANVGPRS